MVTKITFLLHFERLDLASMIPFLLCVRAPWETERPISPSALQFNRDIKMRNSVRRDQWERSRRGHSADPGWCLWGAPQNSLYIFVQQHDKKKRTARYKQWAKKRRRVSEKEHEQQTGSKKRSRRKSQGRAWHFSWSASSQRSQKGATAVGTATVSVISECHKHKSN